MHELEVRVLPLVMLAIGYGYFVIGYVTCFAIPNVSPFHGVCFINSGCRGSLLDNPSPPAPQSALLVLKDSEYTEEKPYRWLTLYLGRAPAPPPDVQPQTEVPAVATGGQQESDNPVEEAPSASPPEPEPGQDGAAEPTEPPEPAEPPLSAQLHDMLGEDASLAVYTPDTVVGQWTALRAHFSDLYRAPEPSTAGAEPPPPGRQVSVVKLIFS